MEYKDVRAQEKQIYQQQSKTSPAVDHSLLYVTQACSTVGFKAFQLKVLINVDINRNNYMKAPT